MFFLLCRQTNDGIFEDFLKIFNHFLKIYKDSSKLFRRSLEHCQTFSENFRTLPKITEDCQRLLRKTRRCFDDTPTNLSTIKETNLISVKSSISSLVRTDMENTPPESRMCFVWILRVVYFPVKHSCLYNFFFSKSNIQIETISLHCCHRTTPRHPRESFHFKWARFFLPIAEFCFVTDR